MSIHKRGDANYRPYRHDARQCAVDSYEGRPELPAWLAGDPIAAQAWDDFTGAIPATILRGADQPTLERMCHWYATWRRLVDEMRADPADHKVFIRLRAASDQLNKLVALFGLSPVDRQRLRIPKKSDDHEYFGGGATG